MTYLRPEEFLSRRNYFDLRVDELNVRIAELKVGSMSLFKSGRAESEGNHCDVIVEV